MSVGTVRRCFFKVHTTSCIFLIIAACVFHGNMGNSVTICVCSSKWMKANLKVRGDTEIWPADMSMRTEEARLSDCYFMD